MIRRTNGVYICNLNGHQLKILYKGSNECEIYLNDKFQGKACFDYVKKKLHEMEKVWDTSKLAVYQFKEFISTIDQTI